MPSTRRLISRPSSLTTYPLDQQLQYARLLEREQLVPNGIEPLQGLDHLSLVDRLNIELSCSPRRTTISGIAAERGSG